jgi:hypothetical protein
MIIFDFETIAASSFSALLYGFVFAILYSLSVVFTNLFLVLFDTILTPQKAHDIKRAECHLQKAKDSPIFLRVVFVFLFGIGFTILSYATLSGIIRLYMVVIALCAFFVPELLLFKKVRYFLLFHIICLSNKFTYTLSKTQKNIEKSEKNSQKLKNIATKSR